MDAVRQLGDVVRARDPGDAQRLYQLALSWARERPQDNAAHIKLLESRLRGSP